ncbi:hypothetical protein CDAR_487721 [Caerostris darwini]|uniref:Uncharacterized protein n=1 Tax=Caerostris darwini TaxID=1538125 RepID=A0AAV4PRI0_9ARAC|nr:hypothetical protein CDAR_487721 [Caerostris darwini]
MKNNDNIFYLDSRIGALCSNDSAARARTCWRASFVFDECHSLAATKPETPFREPSNLQQFIKEACVDSELNGQLIFGFGFGMVK